MKLDNIIYDVDTLQAAITEQWSADSEVFASIYPSDTATTLINGMAAFGSMLQYTLCSALANCYTKTAFSTAAIYQLADTLGNDLHGNMPAQVLVKMTKTNFIGINTTIPAYTSFTINGKKFFNPHAIIIPSSTPTVSDIVLVQGEILEVNKTTSGIPNEKFYFSSDFKASYNYITVTVNGEDWGVVDSFLSYDKYYVINTEEMNVVLLKTDPDGRSYVKVGDSQMATLPSAGSLLQIKYCSNDGANGNIAEVGTYGDLTTQLIFTDNHGNQDALQVEIVTTTTAYGGFSKQSLETLRYTSPYIFASGHRAIRRQDYNALLQSRCGYLTSAVWGEYEEAEKVGAYDSLMMNMVYYTGVKTFETYPYFQIDSVYTPSFYNGALYSNKGYKGSYSFKISNARGSLEEIHIQDTGANGLLFINQDSQDPRDSLLPDWIASINRYYGNILTKIVSGGTNYAINDEVQLITHNSTTNTDSNTGIFIRVTEVDVTGAVKKVSLLTRTSQNLISLTEKMFSTTYDGGSSPTKTGSGLRVNLYQYRFEDSTLVTTNDFDGENSTATNLHPITNAMSNNSNYYQSLNEPSLESPVQIRIDFQNEQGIAGIKFKATSESVQSESGAFIGTVAMFGTNEEVPFPGYYNVRNNENWECIIPRTYLTNPLYTNNRWTNWIATNCFTGNYANNGEPVFNRYKHYVIEFYSCEDTTTIADPTIIFDSMKVLYEEDASVIFYKNNGELRIKFPTVGSPGPGNAMGYLTTGLINTNNFPMYYYDYELSGITEANGYKSGNILAYEFKNETTSATFLVNVVNIDNGIYVVTLNDDTNLTGTELIELASPQSLSQKVVYKHELNPASGIIESDNGTGYRRNDEVSIAGTNLKFRIATVNNNGSVLSVVCIQPLTIDNGDGSQKKVGTFAVTGGSGSGLKVKLTAKAMSGDGETYGNGATINLTSVNNLPVQASFVGNRIDPSDINYYDEPLIKEWNHFTTYLEYRQPVIYQQDMRIQICIDKAATVTSGVIIQEVKNNILKLFEITPDYIGKGLKLSDLYKAVSSTKYVSWCKVLNPLDNVDVSVNTLIIPTFITIEEVFNPY